MEALARRRVAPLLLLFLALASCSDQKPTYPATVTPVYAATAGSGLFIWDGLGWRQKTMASTGPGGLASDNLRSVVVGGSGSKAIVYLGTADAGIARFDGYAWSTWGSADLGSNDVRSLFLGNGLSAATSAGVATYDANEAGTWTSDARVAGATTIFKYGRFTFVGTAADGLYVFTNIGLAKHFTTADGLASNAVKAVLGYSLDEIYVGTDQGLGEYDPVTVKFSTIAGTAGSSVNGLCVDSQGVLYAAADAGIFYHVRYDSASSGLTGRARSTRGLTSGGSTSWTHRARAGIIKACPGHLPSFRSR
jgi:hypothetical protein